MMKMRGGEEEKGGEGGRRTRCEGGGDVKMMSR